MADKKKIVPPRPTIRVAFLSTSPFHTSTRRATQAKVVRLTRIYVEVERHWDPARVRARYSLATGFPYRAPLNGERLNDADRALFRAIATGPY